MTTKNIIRKGDILEHEINVCTGNSMGENAVTSIRVAYEIAEARPDEAVVFVNAFQSGYKFDQSCLAAVGPEFVGQARKKFLLLHSRVGELPSEYRTITSWLEDAHLKVGTIVINSWEFSAKNSPTRERLIFMLLQWAAEMGVTVVLFTQQIGEHQLTAGRYRRGWMGKLMGIVARVVQFEREEPAEQEPVRLVRLAEDASDAEDQRSDEASEVVEATVPTAPIRPIITAREEVPRPRVYSEALAA